MHRIPPSPSVRGNEASKFLHLQLFHCIWEKVMPVDVTNLTGTDTSSKASNSWCHSLHVFTTITTSIDKIYFTSFEHQLLSCLPYWLSLLQPASWIKVKPLEGLESLCPRWTLVYIMSIKTFSIRLFPGPGLSLSFQTSFTCIESYDLQCHQASAFVMPFIATLSRLETGQSGQAALISLIYVTAINGK